MRRQTRLLIAAIPLLLLIGFAEAGVVTAGGGCHGGELATPTEGSATVVKIDGCTFLPAVTRVPAGADVTFLNTSFSPHDITGRDREWGTPSLDVGARYETRFAEAGVYPYSCSLHPGMAGVVIVGSVANVDAADSADLADSTQMAATAPVEPAPDDASGLAWLATGAFGLLAGLGIGAAITSRSRRPA